MAGDDLVLFEQHGHVGVITLSDPTKRNALSDGMIDALVSLLETVPNDVRCLVLTGAGGTFCAGGDIKDMRARSGYASGSPADIRRAMMTTFQRIPRAFFELEVPIIAAVSGHAVGAGCDIAAMCDICIVSETAKFTESFVHLGLLSGDGGTWFLMRAVGYARAAEMTLTGDPVNAATAVAWGLASRMVPDSDLLNEAIGLAERIARHPPQTLRMARRLLREATHSSLHSSLELAAAMQGIAFHTSDQREAVEALLAKRPGKFEGK